MWVRDWIETWGLRVHVLDRTMSLAAINVTGPLAGELLRRAGLADPPRFLGHVHADVAGVPCHVMRLSFTGEAAFELHHPIDRSVELWRNLMTLGADLGIRPHGLQALFGLRLEKGHVIVGMDTELDSTPRRLRMDWAVRMDKPFFLGKPSLARTAPLPDHRRLTGFTMPGQAPPKGARSGRAANRRARDGELDLPDPRPRGHARLAEADAVPGCRRDRRPPGHGRRDAVLRPGGPPCPCLRPSAADAWWPTRPPSTRPRWKGDPLVLRFAPDEAFAIGGAGGTFDDPDAILEPETGFVGAWLTTDELLRLVVPHVEWPLPETRPVLVQGTIAGVPAKLWLEEDRALLLTLAAYRHELESRLG